MAFHQPATAVHPPSTHLPPTFHDLPITGACPSAGGSVPRRVWQLGGGAPPRAVGFLPAPNGHAGTPLALSGTGEMHALAPRAEGAAAGVAAGAGANSSLAAMAGGSRLTSIFGSDKANQATKEALDALALDPEAQARHLPRSPTISHELPRAFTRSHKLSRALTSSHELSRSPSFHGLR